jgi:hypothetical protein
MAEVIVDYDNEKWVELYRSAVLEFQHSLMSGRISDARAEIAARARKATGMPGLSLDNVKLSANDSEPEVLEADRKRGRADNEQR